MPVEIQSAEPYYGLDEDNYADWNGQRGVRRRFDFETLYLDKDFTLASTATLRPDGGCENGGPDAVLRAEPVAAGGEGRAALRQCRYQRRDVGAVSVRGDGTVRERHAARGEKETGRMWVAVPRRMKVETTGNATLVRLGDGLVARLRHRGSGAGRCCRNMPCGATPTTSSTYGLSDARNWWHVALEVGRALGDSVLTLEEDDIARYRFRAKELKMQFVAPVTYMMTDAHLVNPAGTLPRAWRDGVAMGFQRWDSYRVVAGAKIIEQQWGGDSLQAMGLEIRVDPVTARVERTEGSNF